jgi:hypothetical protein
MIIPHLNAIITLIALFGCLAGIGLMFGNHILGIFQIRFHRRNHSEKSGKKLNWLLETTSQLSMAVFIGFSIALGVCVLLLFIFLGKINSFSLVVSFLVMTIPFLFKWYQFERLRLKGSYEGEELINVIINEYINSNYDIIQTIDNVVLNLDSSMTYSKTCLARLGNEIKLQQTEDELEIVIQRFIFSYNTEWANILGFCIKASLIDQTIILDALRDLIESFQRATQAIEKGRRYRRETIVILNILSPLSYFGLIYVAVSMFGMPITTVIKNQLTGDGLQLFLTIISLYMIGLVFGSIVSQPKFDL